MNKLIEVLEIQTYSHKDKAMREYLAKELATIEGCEWHDDGDNIYAGKGNGPRPCVVAHMDTVHPIVENLTAIVLNGKITGMNAVKMEQTGIGGDDKVGVYIALQMLKEQANIKVAFFRDEEVGCLGSARVQKSFFDDVTFVLQCDRKGHTDFITEASGVELSSASFQGDILPIIDSYGYKFAHGMMTDVMELKTQGINVSMANISCGYYNPHYETEYVDANVVHMVCLMVSEILTKMGDTTYPHTAPTRAYDGFDFDKFGRYSGTETHWWDNDDRLSGSSRIHSTLDDQCQDCWQRPATGSHGLCQTCLDYYNDQTIMWGKKTPQVGPAKRSVAEIEADLAKARKRLTELYKMDSHKIHHLNHAKGCKCLECDIRRKPKKKKKKKTYYNFHQKPTF